MLNVLFLDRSHPHMFEWIVGFAKTVHPSKMNILFLSARHKSCTAGPLEIINVHDVPQHRTLEELQDQYDFSIYKTLVSERAFTDYSSFRRSQRYSNLALEEIGKRITPYFNAFDYLIRTRADLVIEGLADNFMTSSAGRIAGFYKKRFAMMCSYYWWADGLLFLDRLDQTSSDIDASYRYFCEHPDEVDRARLDELFSQHSYRGFPGGGVPLKARLTQLWNRRKSYEPLSWSNWAVRRIEWFISRTMYILAINKHTAIAGDERFVYFPLHVSPEATLLGSTPELADQLSLIKNISMNLPWGTALYVKDHPAQVVGLGLDYRFYRQLTSLPNVRYLPSTVSSEYLLRSPQCVGVAVIGGTVGLEAAIARKPVWLFGKTVFGAAACFLKPRDFSEFACQVLQASRGELECDESALYAILMALDATVTRGGDASFSKCTTWEEASFASYSIVRSFINRYV